MKRFYFLALSLIFFISCNEQNKAENSGQTNSSQVDEPKSTPSQSPAVNTNNDDPNFVKTQDTISKYGPRSITRNILQDKNGIYWFATWEGIINYDGKIFTNVTLKEGLRQFHVFSILEDKTGSLWFGTIGGGVYKYDPSASSNSAFTNFTTTDHLAGNVILCMLEDNSDSNRNGSIWFGTDNGVSRFDGYTFTNFTTQDGLSNNFVSTIAQDKTGKLWFGTNGGVCCYNPSPTLTGPKVFSNFINEKEGLSFHNVRSILADNSESNRNGNIWIGSQEGLTLYVPSITHGEQGNFTTLTKNFIGNIFEDKKGNIWLSEGESNRSEMALTKFDGKSFTQIVEDKQVFGIVEDISGNLWFGTANGVRRIDYSTLQSKKGKSLNKEDEGFTDFSENAAE